MKSAFLGKTVLLGQEVHYYMVYIAYLTVAKIVNTLLTKGFMAIFAPAESLPSPATLLICM